MTPETFTLDRRMLTTTWAVLLNPIHTTSQSRLRPRFRSARLAAEERQVSVPVTPTRLVFLTALADPQFQLLQPIELEVERGEGGEYIVSDRRLCNYGAGATLQKALADYQSMLVDLYKELVDSGDILSRPLRERLDDLRTLIAPR